MAGPITHISDTARWVAYYRAMESDRPDAHFRDPYARRLSGDVGARIVRSIRRGRAWAWPMIVRTAVMDEVIQRVVREAGVDTVLNLAAGLDTRPFRLPFPATLRWVDADFPDVLEYKRAELGDARAACAYETAPADLRDAAARRAMLARVAAGARTGLVITEGLLVYLRPDDVAALARDLHAQAPLRWWLLDLVGPRILAMLQKQWGRELTAGNAPVVFGPAEGTAFFAPHGWREAEYRSLWDESLRLRRSVRFAPFWAFLGRFSSRRRREEMRRMSGIALLERA